MRINLRPFFCYLGGKYRIARSYPIPIESKIIEPFAGSAGYSVRYPHFNVHLNDLNPVIAGVWSYLIRVSKEEFLRLPVDITHLDSTNIYPQEAKWLIGFLLNKGVSSPCKSPSKWMRDHLKNNQRLGTYWGLQVKERIASQLEFIRHWKITNLPYDKLGNRKATWFIDPPYQYRKSDYAKFVDDYKELADWIVTRKGQVIACEQYGADYLNFRRFRDAKVTEGIRGASKLKEVLWTKP
jgi:site-specific DNA-adenine methylase